MTTQSKTLGAYIVSKTDPVKKVRDALTLGQNCLKKRREQWQDTYLAYHGYLKEKFKKQRRSNFHYHKVFPQVELEASRMTVGQFSHKPFVGMLPSNGTNFEIAQNRERVVQYYYEHCPGWYLSSMRLLKYTLLYGTAFRVPTWRRITRPVEKTVILDIYGYKFPEKVKTEEVLYDGLWFDVYSPTEVFPHPHGLTLEEKPWVVIRQFVSAEKLLQAAKGGAYDETRVKQIPLNMHAQDTIDYHMRQSEMGYDKPISDEGIVCLDHLLADDHFMTLANNETIIRDYDNWYYHGCKPIVQGIKTLDPDSFYPIATARMILPAQKFANLLLDMAGDNALMSNWPIWKHKSHIDPNWLISVPNQRIPVEDMEDVDIMRMPEMKQDLLQLSALVAASIEETTGYFGTQKGYGARVQSATSDTIFANQGDQRIQYDALTYEKCTLLPEAKMVASLVEQFMPPEVQMFMDDGGSPNFKRITKEEIAGEFVYRVSGISESIKRAVSRADLTELVKAAANTQQFVKLVTGQIVPVPLQNNHYAFKTLYQSFDREDADKFLVPPELFGEPLSMETMGQDGNIMAQVQAILGGGFGGGPSGPGAQGNLGQAGARSGRLLEKPNTQPYQLLGA